MRDDVPHCNHCGDKQVLVTDGTTTRMGCQWCEDLYAADVNLWRVAPPVAGSFTCRMCPRVVRPESYMPAFQKALVEAQLCLRCDHFEKLLRPEVAERVVRVEGRHYFIEDPNAGGISGYGGRRFTIAFNDGRRVSTTNLWLQGDIPKHFRERMPDNAGFVKDGV